MAKAYRGGHERLLSSWMFAGGVTLTACSSLLGIDEPVPPSQGGMGASGGAQVWNGGSGPHGGDAPLGGTGESGGDAPLGGTGESGGGGIGGGDNSGATRASGGRNPEGGASAGSAGQSLTGGNTDEGGSRGEPGGARATGGSGSGGTNGGAGGDARDDSWAGEPGTDPAPALGGACDTEGLLACAAQDPSLRLKCRARRWVVEETCASTYLCDPATTNCLNYGGDCLGRIGVVECFATGDLRDCSNPLRPVWQMCPYGCEGSSCLPGGGEELIVHTEDIITQGRYSSPWPRRIPLCFLRSDLDLNWRAVLQDELERSWERYLDVDFYGWDDCVGDDPGVRVTIRRKCRLTLGTEPAWGFLSPQTPSQVDFCLDYYDAGGVRRHTSEALLRFLARHQFGHVLGLKDSASAPSVMTRALELSQSADLLITEDDLDELDTIGYARKHTGAVVAAASGLCITSSEQGIALLPCIDPSDSTLATSGQVFAANSQQIELAGGGCLVEPDGTASGAASLATCAAGAPTAFKLEPAAWRRQDRCVAPIRPDQEGSLLGLERCDPRDPAWRVWRFEPTSPGHVTIEFSNTGYCVTGQDLGKPLELLPCSGRADQQFQPGSQVLFAASDWCVGFGNDVLSLTSCGSSYAVVRWLVTGTLANDALRLSAAPQSHTLELVPVGNTVAEAELFDVHF